jgi:hypothetical protein
MDSPSRSLAIRRSPSCRIRPTPKNAAGIRSASGHHSSPGEASKSVSAPSASAHPNQPSSRTSRFGIFLEGGRKELSLPTVYPSGATKPVTKATGSALIVIDGGTLRLAVPDGNRASRRRLDKRTPDCVACKRGDASTRLCSHFPQRLKLALAQPNCDPLHAFPPLTFGGPTGLSTDRQATACQHESPPLRLNL